jgi:hypothetical protein
MNLPDYKDIPPDEFAASEMKMTASFGDLTKRCECGCGWLKLGVHIEGKWGEIGALGQAIFWGDGVNRHAERGTQARKRIRAA